MLYLKQSTAATVKLGPFVDDSDGVTPETGLTISQADIRLSKNGGAFAQTHNATGATHDENGWYGIPLDTTDTDTLGRLQVAVYESGALPVWAEFMVVPANVYDSLVAGSDNLQVDATQIEGGDATDAINAACDTAMSDYDAATGAELAAVDGKIDVIDGIVDDILVDTAEIGAAGAGLTAVPWNAAWDAEVQSEVADGLAAYDPPTKAELDNGLAGLNDPTVGEIADQVWDEAKAGHVGAGSFGEEVQAHSLSSEIAALNDPTAGEIADQVWDEAIAGHLGAGTTGAALSGATAPSAAAVADAVWDELVAGHAGVGSTGAALAAAGGGGDPWATALPGPYGAGTAGHLIGTNMDAPISEVPEEVWENPTRTLTMSGASVAAAVEGSQITVMRGDTLSAALTGLGALTGYVSLDFTVKRHKKSTDDEAIIRIRLNATGIGDGLLRLNGAASTPADGSITIDDLAAGDITIALEAVETKELLRGVYYYDVQLITAAGVSTLTLGTVEVVEDVTRLVA